MTDAPPSGPSQDAEPIDTALVRRLADILSDTGLTEIEVERGELRVRVARKAAAVVAAAPAHYTPPPPPAPQPATAGTPSLGDAALAAAEGASLRGSAPPARGDLVKSPMVGTVYLQTQPGTPPFVKVGDAVSEGQTLFIVEAMKTMNPIPAPRSGKVVEVLIADGQPIEFGEPLAVID